MPGKISLSAKVYFVTSPFGGSSASARGRRPARHLPGRGREADRGREGERGGGAPTIDAWFAPRFEPEQVRTAPRRHRGPVVGVVPGDHRIPAGRPRLQNPDATVRNSPPQQHAAARGERQRHGPGSADVAGAQLFRPGSKTSTVASSGRTATRVWVSC